MLEGYTTLGFLAAHTSTVELQLLVTGVTYRHPGPAGQDRHDPRRAVRRSGDARHRRGLVRPRAPRPRSAVPAARRALRATGGDAADRPPDVERRRRTLRRPALLAGRDDQRAAGHHATPPAHHDRRHGGEEDAAAGGAVRRRLQPLHRTCTPARTTSRRSSTSSRSTAAIVGSDFDAIRKTILWTGPLTPDAAGGREFVEQMRSFADVGVDEVHVMPFTGDPVPYIQGLGDHVVGGLSAL